MTNRITKLEKKIKKIAFPKKKREFVWDSIWMPHLTKKDEEEAQRLADKRKHYPYGDD